MTSKTDKKPPKKVSKKTKEKLRSRKFLLQMAGGPGTGKSSLAKRIGKVSGAIVLDRDVIKSTLMSGLSDEEAGPLSYKVLFDMANDLLTRKHSVIVDCPAFYRQIVEDGRAVAAEHDYEYYLIECISPIEVREERLRRRKQPLPSQWTSLEIEDPFSVPGTEPLEHPRLQVDTSEPNDVVLAEAVSYLLSD